MLCAAILLWGCGSESRGPSGEKARRYMAGLDGGDKKLRPGTDANVVYTDAMTLKAQGDCAGAIPKLRMVAELGPGYEVAQTALGECLTGNTQISLDSGQYKEGLTWLRRAADAGWPEAHGRLAVIYALGPEPMRDVEAAGYWLALYRSNHGVARVGFSPLPTGTLARVDAAVPPDAKVHGQKRAQTWSRNVWIPPKPAPAEKEGRKKPSGEPGTRRTSE